MTRDPHEDPAHVFDAQGHPTHQRDYRVTLQDRNGNRMRFVVRAGSESDAILAAKQEYRKALKHREPAITSAMAVPVSKN